MRLFLNDTQELNIKKNPIAFVPNPLEILKEDSGE
jgi:hypothetical protein